MGLVMTTEDWGRVAAAIKARRMALALRQEEATARSGGMVSRAVWSNLERAVQDTYRERTLIGVCRVLGWSDDSIDRILRGDDPMTVAPIVHVSQRPRASARI